MNSVTRESDDKIALYEPTIHGLKRTFGNRLRTVVLFGSRARGKVSEDKDHDIFLAIDNLPANALERLRKVRSAIWEVPLRINTISKTPEEVNANLTPLLLEICVDGICLYGDEFFRPYREKVYNILNQSGLKRKRIGREWYWQFEKIPKSKWELTWEGYREL